MKTTLLIFILSIFCHCVSAQKSQEKSASNGVKYTITRFDSSKNTVISNKNNKLYKDKWIAPKKLTDNDIFSAIRLDKETAKTTQDLIFKAFTNAGKPIPQESIFAGFYINPNGKILGIDFISMASSKLTLNDINLVETTLINKFAFKTEPERLKEMPVIKFIWRITLVKRN